MRRTWAALLMIACGPGIWTGNQPDGWSADARPDLTATITDDRGVPIADSWVTLSPGGRDRLTDADGVAFFAGVPIGTYTVVIAASGFETVEDTLGVTSDGADVSYVLDPVDTSAGLTTTVRDAAGSAIIGARVSLDGFELGATTVDGQLELADLEPGRHSLTVVGPAGRAGSWSTDVLDLAAGIDVLVAVDLPGTIADSSDPIGSDTCGVCHPAAYDAWSQTAHGQATRTPAELLDHPMASGFDDGVSVSLLPEIDATARLATGDRPDQWRVTLNGVSAKTFEIEQVYGGHGPGAALIAEDRGQRVVLPVAWAAAAEGLGGDEAGWVPAYTEGWSSGGILDLDPEPADVSSDLHCGGCHTTGGRLVEGGAGYGFAAVADAPYESVVGCESCHGDGRLHRSRASQRQINIVNPSRLEGRRQVEVCARCHGNATGADHPFTDTPGWPATADGRLPQPDDRDSWVFDRDTFAAVPASKVIADQAGELFASPHHQGEIGYVGACGDCHVAHGSPHPADLRKDTLDNALCTDCHRDLESGTAQREHTHHSNFQPGLWSPGACVGCHMPRTASVVRRDSLSGVGEQRAHTIAAFDPTDILADFDAAGTDRLGPGQVAVNACMDCHIQAAEAFSSAFPGPFGDPYYRVTYVNLAVLQARLWGTE